MPKIGTPARLLPKSAGTAQAVAATSLLVVRYPNAFDTTPAVVDDQTPLSGIFHNYLALLIEAVIAELGPLTEVFRNPNTASLQRFLGTEFANALSNWRSFAKANGGDEAGQIFGLIKVRLQTAVSGWNNVNQLGNINPRSGTHPAARLPVVFCEVSNLLSALSGADMVTACGGGIRGEAEFQSPTVYRVRARGCPATPTGGTTTAPGNPQMASHILLLFMIEAF